MSPYERAVRENLPPPGYALASGFGGVGVVFWVPEATEPTGPHASHVEACLAAWDHYDAANSDEQR